MRKRGDESWVVWKDEPCRCCSSIVSGQGSLRDDWQHSCCTGSSYSAEEHLRQHSEEATWRWRPRYRVNRVRTSAARVCLAILDITRDGPTVLRCPSPLSVGQWKTVAGVASLPMSDHSTGWFSWPEGGRGFRLSPLGRP